MLSSFRNFSKSKFAGLLVFIMIIPFVFWGMGSMFSSGNTNTIAKINKENISTEEFIEYLNNSGIPQDYIRENLDKNIIQELLAGLISSTLLQLEIKNLNISYKTRKETIVASSNVNFILERGEILGIVGESGSGKSTIANAIIKLIDPPGHITSGIVKIDNNALQNTEEIIKQIRGKGLLIGIQLHKDQNL